VVAPARFRLSLRTDSLRFNQFSDSVDCGGTDSEKQLLTSPLLLRCTSPLRRGLVFEARRLFLSLNSRPRVTKKRRRTDSVTLRRVDHQLDAHRAPLTATDSLRSHPARDSPLPHPRVDRDLPECASPPGCAILYGKSFNSKKSSNEVYYTA
jgi:hypothetical protein